MILREGKDRDRPIFGPSWRIRGARRLREYGPKAREICSRHGILFIDDG
jgi:hypothetical protein